MVSEIFIPLYQRTATTSWSWRLGHLWPSPGPLQFHASPVSSLGPGSCISHLLNLGLAECLAHLGTWYMFVKPSPTIFTSPPLPDLISLSFSGDAFISALLDYQGNSAQTEWTPLFSILFNLVLSLMLFSVIPFPSFGGRGEDIFLLSVFLMLIIELLLLCPEVGWCGAVTEARDAWNLVSSSGT